MKKKIVTGVTYFDCCPENTNIYYKDMGAAFSRNLSSLYFSYEIKMDKNKAYSEREKKEGEVRSLLPYWAREILMMWEDAERKHKARRSSLPRDS